MAQEATTVARPYAEAIFNSARDSGSLDGWSQALEFIAAVMRDSAMRRLVKSPAHPKSEIAALVIGIGAGKLTDEQQNLVRLLAENGRLELAAEIAERYEILKNREQGMLDVQVTSAFPLDETQQQSIVAVLKSKLARDIRISSQVDPELIGGLLIRAGDTVIDSSVKGQLNKLAIKLEN